MKKQNETNACVGCRRLPWIKFGWHRVTLMGDFRSDVEAFAKRIGYEVVYES